MVFKNENALLCDAVFSVCPNAHGPPSLSHTAVPVLLISPNNHFNSISRKHQPPLQHQHSQSQ